LSDSSNSFSANVTSSADGRSKQSKGLRVGFYFVLAVVSALALRLAATVFVCSKLSRTFELSLTSVSVVSLLAVPTTSTDAGLQQDEGARGSKEAPSLIGSELHFDARERSCQAIRDQQQSHDAGVSFECLLCPPCNNFQAVQPQELPSLESHFSSISVTMTVGEPRNFLQTKGWFSRCLIRLLIVSMCCMHQLCSQSKLCIQFSGTGRQCPLFRPQLLRLLF
jgi:hypothetical protein